MRRFLALISVLAVACAALCQDKPKIAVGQFDSNRSVSKLDDMIAVLGELLGGPDSEIARAVRSDVVNILVNSRKYEVFATRELDRLLRENRDLRGDRGPFARLRDLTGVRYYVYGAVRRADVKAEFNVFKSFVAHVNVDYRIIDLETGEIVYSKQFDGQDKKTFVMNSEDSKKQEISDGERADLLENAAKQSVRTFVQALGRLKLETPTPKPTEERKPEVAHGLRLEVSGLESLGQARDVERAIEYVKDVDGIKRTAYEAGAATFDISGKVTAEDLGIALERSDKLKELGFTATVVEQKSNLVRIRLKKRD